MLASTGRFTMFIAGAIVLAVITTAFFVVFDLNTAAGSSEGLPVVEIGRSASADLAPGAPADAVPARDGQDEPDGADAVSGSGGDTMGAGVSQRSASGESASQPSAPAAAATATTTREYVEEEVQVNNGRRPDPKTEHPGRGVGLLKKSED